MVKRILTESVWTEVLVCGGFLSGMACWKLRVLVIDGEKREDIDRAICRTHRHLYTFSLSAFDLVERDSSHSRTSTSD